jgi:hypothetical protein
LFGVIGRKEVQPLVAQAGSIAGAFGRKTKPDLPGVVRDGFGESGEVVLPLGLKDRKDHFPGTLRLFAGIGNEPCQWFFVRPENRKSPFLFARFDLADPEFRTTSIGE